jgi:hydrogenase/urease accessory protein HupE
VIRVVGLLLLLVLGALGCAGETADAHEVRPAYLRISQPAPDHYHLLWKQPAQGPAVGRLTPRLSNGWLDRAPTTLSFDAGYRLATWDVVTADPAPLRGRSIRIDGLADGAGGPLADVLVDVDLGGSQGLRTILRADRPDVTIAFDSRNGLAPLAYLQLGIEHILTGFDHLGFVLGLILLVGFRRRLLSAITAFTVAHSLTLAATALRLTHVDPPLVEAMVAMSILFLAADLVRIRQGRPGLTAQRPWLIAFIFGLLHGFAFAGALAEVGRPQNAIPLSLFLFNLGVEIGQLVFVAAVWVTWRSVAGLVRRLPRPFGTLAHAAPPYLIGSLAAFWLWERLTPIFA